LALLWIKLNNAQVFMNYYIFALLPAFFMGLAPIFGKFGLKNVDPAVALRVSGVSLSVPSCID
jgi:uncharacterized membrane protein